METLRGALDEHGFVVLEGALDDQEVGTLTDAMDALHRRRGGGVLHELGFLGSDERFLDLLDHGAVLPCR